MYGDDYGMDVASEVLRLTTEDVPGSPLGRIPRYSTGWGDLAPDNEIVQASAVAEVLDGYIANLADERGLSQGEMKEALLTFTAGDRDPETIASAAVFLSEQCAGEAVSLSGPSAAERHAAAARGHALADGSYPVRDKRELHAAAVLAAGGHGDAAAARKLIRRRAAELGVPLSSLPGFTRDAGDDGDGDERRRPRTAPGRKRLANRRGTFSDGFGGDGGGGPSGGGQDGAGGIAASGVLALAGLTPDDLRTAAGNYEDEELELAARDHDSAAGVMARHPEFFAGRDGTGKAHPPRPRRITNREAAKPAENASVDHEAEVKRYLVMLRSDLSPEKPYGHNVTRKPGPYRSPGPSGRPQSRGTGESGKPQGSYE